MLSQLKAQLRLLTKPGEEIVCAVSGGADSMALLWALYLLKDEWDLDLSAAHFNHHLRGEESDRDEAFVRNFCDRYDIPLHVGSAEVRPGKKGLEAAAREARYGFLRSLKGKIATAHTADDNAETVLLHLIRGTGLKGLGGITPIHGNVIRPMLSVTRQDVETFLEEWCLTHIEDSSNETDAYLRNRIRHHVMPLLKEENPRLGENLSRMALRLRVDEEYLSSQARFDTLPGVEAMKNMAPALRRRVLADFLVRSGVKEPEDSHIAQAESLLYSDKPSAKASLPGGVTIARNYDTLEALAQKETLQERILTCPGEVNLPGLRISCEPAEVPVNTADAFTVKAEGEIRVRSRRSGDCIRLPGGSKSLKKLFIDRKIPAARRNQIPVLSDEKGLLGVYTIGANLDRIPESFPAVTIRFDKTDIEGE